MDNSEPLAFFITWTVYGTFLQGDERWWRSRNDGQRPPQPLLQHWHQARLNHAILLLNEEHQSIVEAQIQQHCDHRAWTNWITNARSNHVHVVVTASGYGGRVVRDQLKANATGGLRRDHSMFVNRPVWTTGGDWKCVNSQEQLEQVIRYVKEVQDRKERDQN
ncbi:hypothetical protein [Allorhodopirellula heiligendammensis]|uniref:Transposase IS200 like protein n=1 Tax=Allorhodopirellula heiligendammensis TaxID=2714739 RepID=A0A5C6C1A0_9BACT|nr:hypothetical protein [Allorhodopirellula heiligendammensis]TWU17902.1 hypothetical protein Poly21_00530 [Allorhodopirellula heiligendammensis]